MSQRTRLSLTVVLSLATFATAADGPQLSPGDKEPILRLEAGGASAYVTALAFSADGRRLFAGGWDKVVRVWELDAKGKFVLSRTAYRIPIGPGSNGTINAIALSPDGNFLAVAGKGVFGGSSGYRDVGRVWLGANLTDAMLDDIGTIYVFDTRKQSVRLLRGHRGTVQAMTFAPAYENKPAILVSVAREQRYREGLSGHVRLWDVDKGAVLDAGEAVPDIGPFRPGLAAWHTGKEVRQLRTAISVYDSGAKRAGSLRIWDVARPKDRIRNAEDEPFTITAAVLPGERVLTAAYGAEQPRLKVWQTSGEGPPRADRLSSSRARFYPRALVTAPSQVNGNHDLAAVVSLATGSEMSYHLHMMDWQAAAAGTVRGQVVLWKNSPEFPVLAASARGEYVAVAGNPQQSIEVHRIADLLASRSAPQILESAGTLIREAMFVTKGRSLGLRLSSTPKASPGSATSNARDGDLLFNPTTRQLSSDLTDWSLSTTDLGNWSVEPITNANQTQLVVKRAGQSVGRIALNSLMLQAGDFALLPPRPPFNVALVAVAGREFGFPVLRLYRADTGETVRQLVGHEDRIHSLAFSADGRLLVSASADQTVSIWSLTSLNQVFDRRGWIHGLSVTDEKGPLVVSQIIGGPARGKLKENERVLGLVENGKLKPIVKAAAFFEAVELIKPGSNATVRVRGADGERDVVLAVGQLTDESKPLLSLFVTRAAKIEDRDWIGWSPIGPYESSAPRVESRLGWHRNTGETDPPVRFAGADEFRKKYFRTGVFEALLASGDPSKVPPPPPPPKPHMGLLLEENGSFVSPDDRGHFFLRQPIAKLQLSIRGRPLDTLKDIAWSVNAGAPQPLTPEASADSEWEAPLRLPGRGIYLIRFSSRSNQAPFAEYTEELLVRYQPLPPRITLKTAQRPPAVRKAPFELSGTIEPGQANEAIELQMTHRHKNKTIMDEKKGTDSKQAPALIVKQRLELRPGDNQVELIAVNRGALRGFEEFETHRQTVEITYIERAAPPEITLSNVVPLTATVEALSPRPVAPVQPLVVSTSRIRVQGAVKAKENLTQAQWRGAEAQDGVNLARFAPGQQSSVEIAEELKLKPGKQSFRFLARTESSDESERVLTVEYRPPTPRVVIEEPHANTVIRGDRAEGVVRLSARLVMPAEVHDFHTAVIANNQEIPIARSKGTSPFAVDVPLRPGHNRIQVRVANEWGGTYLSEARDVGFVRPPKIVKLVNVTVGNRPRVELHALVHSLAPLIHESVELEINGRPQLVETIIPKKADAGGMWLVQLKDVPLQSGSTENQIQLWLSNTEERCAAPGAIQIARPPTAPPRVEILAPREGTVNQRQIPVRLRVRSQSRLDSVKLIRTPELLIRIPTGDLRADEQGIFELDRTIDTRLAPAINKLVVEAVNEDGAFTSPALTINYLPNQPMVLVDAISPRVQPNKTYTPARDSSASQPRFEEIAESRVRVRGRIRWGDAQDVSERKKIENVRVFVNGFQQAPTELKSDARNEHESMFEADLVLNRHENKVLLAVREQNGGVRFELQLRCREPESNQRLHMLILSSHDADGPQIDGQLRKAFELLRRPDGALQSPAFQRVIPYPPLTGEDMRRTRLLYQLLRISTNIKKLTRAGSGQNDVVIIYFKGGEEIETGGHFFHSGQDRNASERINSDEFVRFFAETPGAHLLLLDVDRKGPGKARDLIRDWEPNYRLASIHMALLRYSWLSGEDAPKDARLISAIESAMPRVSKLVEMINETERFATNKQLNYPDSLEYMQYAPAELRELIVGRIR